MLKRYLPIQYHDFIYIGIEHAIDNYKYVIVDDGSYSGIRMLENMSTLSQGDLYIILIAASEEAIHNIKYDRSDYMRINVNILDMFIGAIYPNVFKISPKDLYLEWDIIYESNGKIYSLLGIMLDQGTSPFYFQHKLADAQSKPGILRGLRNPKSIDRILTREEKNELLNEHCDGYWELIDPTAY